MKDLENRLLSLDIPIIESDKFKQTLHDKLVNKYYKKENIYKIKFRYSVAFACVMALIAVSVIIFPEISIKANEIAFKNDLTSQEENNTDYSDDEFFKKFAEDNDKFYYTSINNPNLKNRIDPTKYEEDKAYIIRKYVSQDSHAVMIISEFNKPEQRKQLREVSF
ncbi:MAG: hypothetical protein P9L97_09255 [Candidatus Tenebribacter davisii]|jgi:hypothetical protein|nr:hypothetical protein [Candidatus Tenebribacter davisii]